MTLPSPAPSLFDAVTAVPAPGALAGIATSGGRAAWLGLYPEAALQPSCNAEGFNVDPGTYIPRSRVRLGLAANGENDCISPDSYLGVGGELMSGNQCTVGVPSGGYAAGIVGGGGGDGGDVQGGAFAYVFVREP